MVCGNILLLKKKNKRDKLWRYWWHVHFVWRKYKCKKLDLEIFTIVLCNSILCDLVVIFYTDRDNIVFVE